MQPLGNRVLVKAPVKDKTTTSGIIIPDSISETSKTRESEVIAVGTRVKENIKVGDIILFGKYSGFECDVNGEKCLVILVDDAFGIK